jgi:hypothetical protein
MSAPDEIDNTLHGHEVQFVESELNTLSGDGSGQQSASSMDLLVGAGKRVLTGPSGRRTDEGSVRGVLGNIIQGR